MSLHLSNPQTQCACQANCTKVLRGVIFVTTLSVFCRSLREKAYEIVTTVKRTLNTRDVGKVASSFPHGLTMAPVVPDREQPLMEHAYECVGYYSLLAEKSICESLTFFSSATNWFIAKLNDELGQTHKNLCRVCGGGGHTLFERLCLFHIFVFSVNIFKVIVKFYKYFNWGLNR